MRHPFKISSAIIVLILAFTSCQKDMQTQPQMQQGAVQTLKSAGVALSGSTDCCTSGTVEDTTGWVDSADAIAGNWPPLYFDFCSGDFVSDTDPYHLVWHNRFNSYITGTSGWTLTYLNEGSYPVTNYSSITCIPTGALNASVGNTMGMGKLNGMPMPVPGWYDYNTTTRTITPYRLMVLSNGTRHFLIYIESVMPEEDNTTSPPQYRARIKFHYKCLSACV